MSSKPLSRKLRRPRTFGPLYDFLSARFPGYRSALNVFDIPRFAAEMGYAHETLYKAVRSGGLLKIGVALSVIQLSRETDESPDLHWEDLVPFILPEYDTYRADAPAGDVDDLLS